MANTIVFKNPLSLDDHEAHVIPRGKTFREWLALSELDSVMRTSPMVTVINGDPFLEKDWDRKLFPNDLIALQAIPQGGFILVAAKWVVANWVAVSAVASAALALYGVLAQPDMPEAEAGNTSPNHTLSVRSNQARMGQPKPVGYGRNRTYPDLSAQPYAEYSADDERTIWMLYEIGIGEYEVDESSARFEDTLLSDFSTATLEIIPPGATSSLFTNLTDTSTEVSNIEIEALALGPYVANPTATTITQIGVDIVAPGGLYRSRSSGKRERLSRQVIIEAQTIDASGNPVGAWFELGRPNLSGSNPDPILKTYRYSVPSDRYQVRVTPVTPPSGGDKISDTLQWSQLRGHFSDGLPVTNTTRAAVQIRESSQIGSRALTKFNILHTRKLPTWTGSAWTAPIATRSPVWAFADVCRAEYGGKRSDAYINLDDLLDLSLQASTEGINCDGVFDSPGTVWGALERIALLMNAVPIDEGGVYTMIRDEAQSTPTQMFNMRNQTQGSYRIDQQGVLEETADHVVVEYYDELQDYRLTSMSCILPGGTNLKPKIVRLWGVVENDKAHAIGIRLAAVNRYRRERHSFITGMEGRIPRYGDQIRTSHFAVGAQSTKAQHSGDVRALNGDVLTLWEKVTGLYTSPYIVIPDLTGAPQGPYPVTVISDHEVRIESAFNAAGLVFGSNYDDPRYHMGEGSAFDELIKVDKITPQSNNLIKIEGYLDAPEVYTAIAGRVPPTPLALTQLQSLKPTISKLEAILGGNPNDPDVYLSWASENCDRYDIQYSIDLRATWIDFGEDITTPRFRDFPDHRGVIWYRVSGLSIYRSEWVEGFVDTIQGTYIAPALADFDSSTNEIFFQDAEPVGGVLNDLWHETDTNLLYYYNDISWVVIGNAYELTSQLTDDAELAGAILGLNLKDSEGGLVSDIKALNKFVSTNGLGGELTGNPFFTKVDTELDRPAGWFATYNASNSNVVSWGNAARTTGRLYDPAETNPGIGMSGQAFRVNKAQRIRGFARYRLASGFVDTNGMYIRVLTKEAPIAADKNAIGWSTGEDSVDFGTVLPHSLGAPCFILSASDTGHSNAPGNRVGLSLDNVSVSELGTWQTVEFEFTAPDNAEWASPVVLNWSGLGAAASIEFDSFFLYTFGTSNVVYRQASTPTNGAEGDLWHETDTDIWYQYTSGTWQVAANSYDNTGQLVDGAGLGNTADWPSVTGTGRPADNATQNNVYRQATAPVTGVQNGDLWYETDTSLWYQRFAGSWQAAGRLSIGDLADKDDIDQSDVVVGALSTVAQAESAGPIAYQGTTWNTIETVDITLPASITNSSVLIDFITDTELIHIVGAPPPESQIYNCSLRLLDDNNNVVDEMPYRIIGTILDSSTPIKERWGSRNVAYSYRVPSTSLNSSQVNTFKIQMREPVAVADIIRAKDFRLRALALHQTN